jgi:hypothetical protein
MILHWDPNEVGAPEGYTWFGYFAFICFGPAREKIYFSATLALGGTSDNLKDRKAEIRMALCKNTIQCDNASREAGGDKRVMTL